MHEHYRNIGLWSSLVTFHLRCRHSLAKNFCILNFILGWMSFKLASVPTLGIVRLCWKSSMAASVKLLSYRVYESLRKGNFSCFQYHSRIWITRSSWYLPRSSMLDDTHPSYLFLLFPRLVLNQNNHNHLHWFSRLVCDTIRSYTVL